MDGGARDDTASVQILDKGKEKQESPTMRNGRTVTTCHLNGGVGDDTASVQILDKGKEKQQSPTMMIGRMVTTCHKDGEADQGAITWREEMVNDRALIDKMKVMLKLHRQSMEEDDNIIENLSQSLIRVGKDFNKWRSAHQKQEYSVSLLDRDKDEGCQTTGSPQPLDETNHWINSEKVLFFPKDGETEGVLNTPNSLQLKEKKEKPPDVMNGEKSSPDDGWQDSCDLPK